MLAKLLLIIGCLVIAGGAFFSLKTRSALIATRNEKIEINSRQLKPLKTKIDEQISELEKERSDWQAANTTRKDLQVALTNNQGNVKAKTDELAQMTKEIEDKQAEVAKLEAQIQSALGTDTIETITARTEELGQQISGLEGELENGKRELEIAQKKASDVRRVVSDLQRTAAQRNRGISRNSVEGTVIEASKEYGFAVINIGADRGVTPDSRLIVRRGDQRIGTLKISSVQGGRTIADIVSSSLAAGEEISPGDKVIFEKVQR